MTVEIKGFGKITASKEVLNELCVYLSEAQDGYNNRGYNALGDKVRKIWYTIYDKLDEQNYYN